MLRTAFRGASSIITLVAAVLTINGAAIAASDNKKPLSVSVSTKTATQQPSGKVKASAAMAKVPLAFETNSGQVDSRVQYLSRGAGYTLFLTRDEAVLSLTNLKGQPDVLRVKLTGGCSTDEQRGQMHAMIRLRKLAHAFRQAWRIRRVEAQLHRRGHLVDVLAARAGRADEILMQVIRMDDRVVGDDDCVVGTHAAVMARRMKKEKARSKPGLQWC